MPGEVGDEAVREDHREEPLLGRERKRLTERGGHEVALVHPLDPRSRCAGAEGDRRGDIRRDDVEQGECELHDLGRDAVGMA